MANVNRALISTVIGLLLWLLPWPAPLWGLHEVGKVVFVIGFACWLGLFHPAQP